MSLKNRYKTSSQLVRDGVWFDLGENSDKSMARIRLRRHGRTNRDWVTAFRKHTADVDMETISPEHDERITAAIFVDSCVVDWEAMQPEDDGNNVPFSKEAALELFADPEWNDLLKECQAFANTKERFQAKRDGEAKN